MNTWKNAARQALISGTAGSLLSTVVMALAGSIENRAPAGPINGPSQWLFGRKAARHRGFNLGYTIPGFLIHQATAMGWALLHERVFGRRKQDQTPARRLRNAAITATVANVVDYKLTPRRLQPGFDAQLSKGSLLAIYAAFAVGLTVYDFVRQRRANRRG
jgi:hypothetical protein